MSTTIDQQFVEFIVKSLVSNPDKVSIKRSIDEKGVLLELSVDSEDLGRVIGKRGASAQALRTLLRALGTKNDARYNLKIIDPEGGERPRRDDRNENNSRNEESDKKAEEISPSEVKPKNVEVDEKTSESKLGNIKEEKPALEEEKPDEAEEDGRSSFERTRRELQDLDDLDI